MIRCEKCSGHGYINIYLDFGMKVYGGESMVVECPICGGKGVKKIL